MFSCTNEYAQENFILHRFFQLMGSVFGFVSSDLKQKIEVLIELSSKNGENYTTVKAMIEYEKENKLLDKGNCTNGARTLLRLHRGLGTAQHRIILAQGFISPWLTNFSIYRFY